MQKLVELKDFDSFLLERKENTVKRDAFIEKVVSNIKKKFGLSATDFITSAKQKGVDEIQDFIIRTVEPYVEKNEGGEGEFFYDYDGLLSGLVSWVLFTMELKTDNKQ